MEILFYGGKNNAKEITKDEKHVAIVEKYLQYENSQNGTANEAQLGIAAFRRCEGEFDIKMKVLLG